MSINGYTIGKSVSLQLYDNFGVMTSFAMRTRFTSRQRTNRVQVKRFDGSIDFLEIPDGWEGTLDYTRQDSRLDDYVAKIESNFYLGVDINPAQLTETIVETAQAISQYRYLGVMFRLEDAGDKVGDDVVKQRLGFVASKRVKV